MAAPRIRLALVPAYLKIPGTRNCKSAATLQGRIPGSADTTVFFDYHSLDETRFIQFFYIAES